MNPSKPVIFLTFANDKVDDLQYLRNLPKELHGIRDSLDIAAKAGLCEIVERTAATIDQIFDVFQDPAFKDRIAIFHYGGHAHGTQLMLETLDGGKEASHGEGLVSFFGKQKGLQLVFFNGCSSQQQAEDMIKEGVPAVIGTSTAISDEVATDLSIRFYKGMANGESIEQAWLHAIDVIKTKKGDDVNHRGLRLRRDESSEFPWDMIVRRGSEIVKEWNLPMAVNNPLFGLPDLPKLNLPENPFLFLRRYQREHAEIFFGRGSSIRKLYDRATTSTAAPVILFYGQSGVGKSSLLDAGIFPRLDQVAYVKYLRRDEDIGLLGMLDDILGAQFDEVTVTAQDGEFVKVEEVELKLQQIAMLAEGLDKSSYSNIMSQLDKAKIRLKNALTSKDKKSASPESTALNRLECWKEIEAKQKKPFIIILDQVEEVFTRVNDSFPNELDIFLRALKQIFGNPTTRPLGKIILTYRKEFHPELNEHCKKLKIPRESIFLSKLEKADIAEVVTGLISTERLQNTYHVNLDPDLPVVIADDLLADKETPNAPMLQIVLTKLWEMTYDNEIRHFSVENYQMLRQNGLLMDDFFSQQMVKLQEWNPKLEKSGLALDLLNYHITSLGTAGLRNRKQLNRRYEHKEKELELLLMKLKELYLITDAGNERTCLSHDTLAPIVQKAVRNSDKPGQRALRVLASKLPVYVKNEKSLLDRFQLKDVLSGKQGMRLWSSNEKELVEKSKRRVVFKRFRLSAWIFTTLIVISFIYGWADSIRNQATEQTRRALSAINISKAEVAQAKMELETYEQEKERLLNLINKSKDGEGGDIQELADIMNKMVYERDSLLKAKLTIQQRNDRLSAMNERLAKEKQQLNQKATTLDSSLITKIRIQEQLIKQKDIDITQLQSRIDSLNKAIPEIKSIPDSSSSN